MGIKKGLKKGLKKQTHPIPTQPVNMTPFV